MESRHQALYDRLERFQIDEEDHPAFSFADRLAKDNGWSQSHTQRVVGEYRRFLLLCVIAGHPVSPSEDVDQAWHLHMIYTRSYWERLCSETLGQPIHHGPTRGGAAESVKFHDWYQQTLESYAAAFGEAPPPDIWPPARERFARTRFVRVDRSTNWVIRKPRVRTSALAAALGVIAVGFAGCTDQWGSEGFERTVVIVGLCVVVGAAALGFLRRWLGGGDGHGCGGGGCATSGDSGCGGGSGGD